MRKIHMVGKTYGRLTVTAEVDRQVVANCECGREGVYLRGNLLAGYTKSCGCYRNDQVRGVCTTHGHKPYNQSASPTYNSWRNMKRRCNDPNNDHYHRYGGRGITYDPRWEDFNNFLEDMGQRPDGTELDREDNNRNYTKSNCRWITHKENCENRGY